MARPKKTGFDYFPFDVDLFSDYKVRKLMRHQGGSQAVAVYALLLCNIYRNGYYLRWDEELPFFMSETLGVKEAYIAEVIQYCAAVGLIDKELYDKEKVLTSVGIQKRYIFICQQARRASVIKEYNLVSSEETHISSEETAVSSEETRVITEETAVSSEFSTQRKEKKRKGKESKENTPPQTPPRGELGGGAFSLFSLFLTTEMCTARSILTKSGVSENDAWEFSRLAAAPEMEKGYAVQMAEEYANLSPSERQQTPFYMTVQSLQRLEQQGRIHPMLYDDFRAHLFISRNILGADAATIYRTIGTPPDPRLIDELKRLVAEIIRPGSSIQQPAKFIIAGLRKLQSSIQHQSYH